MREEWSLVQQAQDGDRRAFRDLVERHRKRVFYLAFDLSGDMQDAEDISQETFVKMYKALHTFRGDAKLSSWLYRITVNTWINSRRGRAARLKSLEHPLDETLNGSFLGEDALQDAPDSRVESIFTRKRILNALDRLSDRERSVFVMRHFHGLKLAEIGKTLSLSLGTVKTMNFRATVKMRELLGQLASEL